MEKLCRIRELQRAVNRFEAALERSYGICLNEGMALCSLSKAGRLSCGELGEMLGLTPSNTSKVLRSVEGKGYVNRELGTNDKRQMYFSLTEKGRVLLGRNRNARITENTIRGINDANGAAGLSGSAAFLYPLLPVVIVWNEWHITIFLKNTYLYNILNIKCGFA